MIVIDMSEQTIRKNLLESKVWEEKLDSLIAAKEMIDEDTVNVTFDSNIKTELYFEFNMLLKTVEEKVQKLSLLDAELGLHTLAPSKVKENVVYPNPFQGAPGEDVYNFVKEFEEAIAADQVRTKDEVKTLIKYLKGKAKETIGKHHKTLRDAFNDLKGSYGNPQWIWLTIRQDFENEVHFRTWGKPYTCERLKSMNQMLNFIRKAEALAEEHQSLHGEVYCSATISMLKQLVLYEYKDKINHEGPISLSKQEKMMRIKAILEAEKDATLNGIPDEANYVPKKSKSEYTKAQYGSRSHKQSRNMNGHACPNPSQCNTKWDKLGCLELYKLTSVKNRRDMLISIEACFKYEAPFTAGLKDGKYLHSCKWSPREKLHARCQGQNGSKPCYFAAATCLLHRNNKSQELKSSLFKSKLKDDVVDYKPSIKENLREKEKLIKLLKSEKGNLDIILSSYKNKRKQEKLMPDIKKVDEIQAKEATEHINDEDMAPLDNKQIKITKECKKSMIQLKNPENENWEPPCVARSTRNVSSLVNSSSVYHCMPPITCLELKFKKHKRIGVGGKGSLIRGEQLNGNNPVKPL